MQQFPVKIRLKEDIKLTRKLGNMGGRYTHSEVRDMTREYMMRSGYKIDRSYPKARVTVKKTGEVIIYDDIFTNDYGHKLICEYKPFPLTRSELFKGISQTIFYSMESKMRAYIVISALDYSNYEEMFAVLKHLGVMTYQNGKIMWHCKPFTVPWEQDQCPVA